MADEKTPTPADQPQVNPEPPPYRPDRGLIGDMEKRAKPAEHRP